MLESDSTIERSPISQIVKNTRNTRNPNEMHDVRKKRWKRKTKKKEKKHRTRSLHGRTIFHIIVRTNKYQTVGHLNDPTMTTWSFRCAILSGNAWCLCVASFFNWNRRGGPWGPTGWRPFSWSSSRKINIEIYRDFRILLCNLILFFPRWNARADCSLTVVKKFFFFC